MSVPEAVPRLLKLLVFHQFLKDVKLKDVIFDERDEQRSLLVDQTGTGETRIQRKSKEVGIIKTQPFN